MSDYKDNGFAILPSVLPTGLLERVRAETTAVCRGQRGDIAGAAPAVPDEADAEVLRRYLCIHFPHKISDLLREVATLPVITRTLTEVIGPDVKMMQSMLFIKAEGKPGQAWHQDEAHIPTRDRSLTGVWIALDDATVENGCLWALPGSHKRGVLYPERDQADSRFDCTMEAHGFSDADQVPLEVPAGSAVVFNGYLLHRSLPNTGRHGLRRAYVAHYMSAQSLLPWMPPTATDQRMGTHDFRDIIMIAGSDPYAYKGTADVMQPMVRPDKEGGCLR